MWVDMSINGDCSFCLNAKENINHIFKSCDFASNIWYTSENNCPNPLNTNLDIVDWLEYLGLNELWFRKNFDNVLE